MNFDWYFITQQLFIEHVAQTSCTLNTVQWTTVIKNPNTAECARFAIVFGMDTLADWIARTSHIITIISLLGIRSANKSCAVAINFTEYNICELYTVKIQQLTTLNQSDQKTFNQR